LYNFNFGATEVLGSFHAGWVRAGVAIVVNKAVTAGVLLIYVWDINSGEIAIEKVEGDKERKRNTIKVVKRTTGKEEKSRSPVRRQEEL